MLLPELVNSVHASISMGKRARDESIARIAALRAGKAEVERQMEGEIQRLKAETQRLEGIYDTKIREAGSSIAVEQEAVAQSNALVADLQRNLARFRPACDLTAELSPDLLALIFGFVAEADMKTTALAIPATCRRWAEVCRDRVDVDVGYNVTRWCSSENRGDVMVGIIMGRLKVRKLLGDMTTEMTGSCFANRARCAALRELRTSWCKSKIPASALQSLVGLKALDVYWHDDFGVGLPALIERGLPGLEALSLNLGNYDASKPHAAQLPEHWPAKLAARSPGLLSLKLDCNGGRFRLEDAAVVHIVAHCKQLKVVRVIGFELVTDIAVTALSTLPELEVIDVGGSSVTSDGLAKLEACTKLKSAHLSRCTQVVDCQGFASLLRKFPGLGPIPYGGDDDESHFIGIYFDMAEYCRAIADFRPNLTELDLTFSSVTDADISALAACTKLCSLDLCGCYQFTGSGLASLAPCHKLARLELVDTSLTSAGLEAVSIFTELTELRLPDEFQMTDAALAKVSTCIKLVRLSGGDYSEVRKAEVLAACTKLSALYLRRGKYVTDAILQKLAAACAELERVNLNSCRLVTDAGLSVLAACCKKLKRRNVAIYDCPLVTKSGKAVFPE